MPRMNISTISHGMSVGRFKIGRSMPKLRRRSQLLDAVRRIARDRERLDHLVGDRRGRLRARRLVLIELDDALAVVAEAEAGQELGVVLAHAADVEAR